MDRGAWRAIVYRVAKSQIQLSDFAHTHSWQLQSHISLCVGPDLGIYFSLGKIYHVVMRRYILHIIKCLFHFAYWYHQSSPHTQEHSRLTGNYCLSFSSCISILCVCEHHHIHLLPWQELLEWMIQRETNDQYWTGGSNSKQEVPRPVLQGFAPTWVLSRLQIHTAQFLHYEEYCTEPGAS